MLLHGDAGNVIHAFGSFVVGGNILVGMVVFLILVVIQFVVITNGAGRVAEVAARFTLDAMPGKQMAIDADLNAGQITDQQARQRREEIAREADFYGAMDGASKFVKGDAMAGILIVAINLLGGIGVGLLQRGMSFSDAAHTFPLLTIGDGLAAQIPALLISTAMGIIVTRSGSESDLGSRHLRPDAAPAARADDRRRRSSPRWALVPGLPKLPFVIDRRRSSSCSAGRWSPHAARRRGDAGRRASSQPAPVAQPGDAAVGALADRPARAHDRLRPRADGRRSKSGGSLLGRVGVVRRQIASELGMVIAPVRIHDDVGLDSHEYAVKVRGVEVARGAHHPRPPPGDEPGRRDPGPGRHPHHRAGVRAAGGVDRRERAAPRPRRSATRSSTPSR